MSRQPQPVETPDEWAERMIREHGPVPMRIGRRLAHLFGQQQAAKLRGEAPGTSDEQPHPPPTGERP